MSRVRTYNRRWRITNGNEENNDGEDANNVANATDVEQSVPPYRFFCQLAHGSPTGIISGFRTNRELYMKISECFEINPQDIMYITLNTHKLDVEKVLRHRLGINDFLFVHIRCQPKEVYIRKDCQSFGMTLADTGSGVVFIKRIHPGGLMSHLSDECGGMIEIGDQIERINEVSFAGRRHYEVAAYLRSIPLGETLLLRLVSPERSPIYMLQARAQRSGYGPRSGRKTIRLNASGPVEESDMSDTESRSVSRINSLLDFFLSFEDEELAQRIYTLVKVSGSPIELKTLLNRELYEFSFPPELIYQIWMVYNDFAGNILTRNLQRPQLETRHTRSNEFTNCNSHYAPKVRIRRRF